MSFSFFLGVAQMAQEEESCIYGQNVCRFGAGGGEGSVSVAAGG